MANNQRNEYKKQWYWAHRDEVLAKVRARSKGRHKKRYADPSYRRQVKDWGVRKLYGISLEEYEKRLAGQNNLCAICGELMDGEGATSRAPVLDHCHKEKRLREFVHQSCNRGIGYFGDDPEKLRRAAAYLERHK